MSDFLTQNNFFFDTMFGFSFLEKHYEWKETRWLIKNKNVKKRDLKEIWGMVLNMESKQKTLKSCLI